MFRRHWRARSPAWSAPTGSPVPPWAIWPLIERIRVPLAIVAGANGPLGAAAPSAVTIWVGTSHTLAPVRAPRVEFSGA